MNDLLVQLGGVGAPEFAIILLIFLLLTIPVLLAAGVVYLVIRLSGDSRGADDEELRRRVEELEAKVEDREDDE